MKMQHIILGVILVLLVFYYIFKFTNNVRENFQDDTTIPVKNPEGMGLPQDPPIYLESYSKASNLPATLIFNLKIDPKRREIDSETGKEYKRLLVPLHIIKTFDNKYISIFNDGKLYKKNDIYQDKLWIGPLNNSLFGSQEDGIGFRMIMLFPFNVNQERQIRMIGVGQDCKLYYKESEDIQSKWVESENQNNPSNANLIYLFCDYHQSKEKYYPLLYGITKDGKFVYKNLKGEAPPNTIEIDQFINLPFTIPKGAPDQNIKVLKVFWDRNGFMIGIGQDFRLYQKRGTDWINRPWETNNDMRGNNPGSNAQIIDMLMDSDARMLSLKFMIDSNDPMILLQKQDQTHYLADHDDPESVGTTPRVFSDVKLTMFKTGLDWETYLSFEDPDEILYRSDNLQAIHQRSIMVNRLKLRQLCKSRNPTMNLEARNFKLENAIQTKETRVEELRHELDNLITPITKQDPFYQGL